jgi:hypothetical protein
MSIQLQRHWGSPLETHEFIQSKRQGLNGRIFPKCRILGGGVSMRRHYLHILKKLRIENGECKKNRRERVLDPKRERKT